MRVTGLVVDVVEWEVASIPVADGRDRIGGVVRTGVVRVRTDEGIEGNAFLGPLDAELAPCLVQLTEVLRPRVLGLELSGRDRVWDQLEGWAGHGYPLHAAFAAVDIALWDIDGKAAGAPVHALLGSACRELPVVATSPPLHVEPAAVAAQVAEARAAGYPAYKIHPGAMPPAEAATAAGLARVAAGPAFELMLDPNNAYDLATALEVGRALDEHTFAWFEDPVHSDDWEAMVELSAQLDTPLAMSDALGFLFRHTEHAIRLGAVQIFRGNARKLGVTGLTRLCRRLEASGLRCEIGFGGNALTNAANLHVGLAVENSTYYEHFLPAGYHEIGVLGPVEVRADGTVAAPTRPGIGLDLDEQAIQRHTVHTIR